MSIATAIQNAQTKVAAAYTSCNNKGATMPAAANQNLSNLATTIDSIVTDVPGTLCIQKVIRSEDNGVVTYSREEEYVGAITQLPNQKYRYDTTIVDVMIPDTITLLGGYAFQDCSNLKSVNLECVTRIGEHCFQRTSLESINITESLTTIEGYAFSECKLTKVKSLGSITTLPNGGVGGGVFGWNVYGSGYALEEIWLPATLTSIGTFCFNGQSALSTVVCLATTPPTLDSTAFRNTPSTFKLYVPYSDNHSVLSAYQNATNWSTFASRTFELNQDGTIPV